MPEAITAFFEEYGFYINIAFGALIFIGFTALRNKIARVFAKDNRKNTVCKKSRNAAKGLSAA